MTRKKDLSEIHVKLTKHPNEETTLLSGKIIGILSVGKTELSD